MPRISEFYGIVIAMHYREHGVPHFHATYGEHVAAIAIVWPNGADIAPETLHGWVTGARPAA